ncbi:MAG: hypothetical protein AAFQ58_23540 [Pseudomonadota bacterium]
MPSPHNPSRVCFFGDSQIASARLAMTEGLTSVPDDVDIEFWGATGPAFRQIEWRGGAMRATGAALEIALTINGRGRDHLAPGDFDTFVFYGARLRTAEFFGPYLQWHAAHGTFPSAAALHIAARTFMDDNRAYRNAVTLAAHGARVIFVPAPLYTNGVTDLHARGRFLHAYPRASEADADARAVLWQAMTAVARSGGVTLVPQPEDTVTNGVLTKAEFACEGAVEVGDTGHKSAAFAARWLQDVWPLVTDLRQAA